MALAIVKDDGLLTRHSKVHSVKVREKREAKKNGGDISRISTGAWAIL